MTTRISKKKNSRSRTAVEPRKTPVQERSKESVRAILEAAAQVFDQYGYAHGTTNRIAERAGVSIGTLYQYFPNKESVVVTLLEEHLNEGQRQINDWVAHVLASKMDLNQTISVFIEGMLDMHSDRPRLQHVLLEETQIPPRLHDMFHDIELQAAKTIAGLLKLFPEVKIKDLETATLLMVQTIEVLTHRFASHPNMGLTRQRFTTELASMLLAYHHSSKN